MSSVIIGTGCNAFRAYKAIHQETNLGYKVNAFVSDQKIGIFAKHVDFISEQNCQSFTQTKVKASNKELTHHQSRVVSFLERSRLRLEEKLSKSIGYALYHN